MKKTAIDLILTPPQRTALTEFKQHVQHAFTVREMVLFGSTARGVATKESDLDVLILTDKALTRTERHIITDIAFEINLKYGANISSVVLDESSWKNGRYSVLPLKAEINKEGIRL